MANYQYNGIELPELPDVDRKEYPFAFIVRNQFTGSYAIHFFNKIDYGFSESGNWCIMDNPRMSTTAKVGDAEWLELTYYPGTTGLHYAHTESVLWADFDVLNADGSVYLAASDPVPVGGEPTLTARDLYRKINGKPTKLTLYKKLGGKLIPLDEYTKEVTHD